MWIVWFVGPSWNKMSQWMQPWQNTARKCISEERLREGLPSLYQLLDRVIWELWGGFNSDVSTPNKGIVIGEPDSGAGSVTTWKHRPWIIACRQHPWKQRRYSALWVQGCFLPHALQRKHEVVQCLIVHLSWVHQIKHPPILKTSSWFWSEGGSKNSQEQTLTSFRSVVHTKCYPPFFSTYNFWKLNFNKIVLSKQERPVCRFAGTWHKQSNFTTCEHRSFTASETFNEPNHEWFQVETEVVARQASLSERESTTTNSAVRHSVAAPELDRRGIGFPSTDLRANFIFFTLSHLVGNWFHHSATSLNHSPPILFAFSTVSNEDCLSKDVPGLLAYEPTSGRW